MRHHQQTEERMGVIQKKNQSSQMLIRRNLGPLRLQGNRTRQSRDQKHQKDVINMDKEQIILHSLSRDLSSPCSRRRIL
jgi:hypothetical protein